MSIDNIKSIEIRQDADQLLFQVDHEKAKHYLYFTDRSRSRFDANRQIPIGKNSFVDYSGTVMGGVSDRPISSYQTMLFPDIFSNPIPSVPQVYSIDRFLMEAVPLDLPDPELGGFDNFFLLDSVVLDIASGEAVADMQLSIKFPNITIIGTDILYKQVKKVFPNKKGLQLTHGDWKELGSIPDSSVDRIMSVQGITQWALPANGNQVSVEQGLKIISSINRVSKPFAIVRFDTKNPFLCDNIGDNWQISSRSDVFIAQRKN